MKHYIELIIPEYGSVAGVFIYNYEGASFKTYVNNIDGIWTMLKDMKIEYKLTKVDPENFVKLYKPK